MLAVEGPSRSRNPAKYPEESTGLHTLSLSKYLICGSAAILHSSFPSSPTPHRRSPFHHLYLNDHPNYIPQDVMFFPFLSHPTIFPFPEHMSYTALQPRCSISLWTQLFIYNLVNRPKSDRRATDANTRCIRLADSHLLLSFRVMVSTG